MFKPIAVLTILVSVVPGILIIRSGLQLAKPILVTVATAGRSKE
ncbi:MULTISPECIES: hypothetical protein [Brevibacterium]|uniref:Uncharacterized protein n=1 Tax=Brevibacterium antiquum CNRZ 918 TaxID=1255637 RepID=A0A2H1I6Q7_9MICO|nr:MULTISPECIES: hypothetical protein [Brevibacterium]SMX70820.1 hypothetical protein BANT918_00613 [Brevibacterium antiquum CNRZ 918]